MPGGYRIRAGTHTVAEMTETYDVRSFPRQVDQGGFGWFSPVDPSGNVREFATETEDMDGGIGGFGGVEFSWFFGALTALQVKYLRDTFFGSVRTAVVTVRTWDRSSGWRVFNCTARWNDPAQNAEPAPGMNGYLNLKIDFIKATEAAA